MMNLLQFYVSLYSINANKNVLNLIFQHIYFSILGSALWLFGSLYHLFWSTDFSTYPQFNIRINTHLHIDAFLIFTGSLLYYAFPDFVIAFLVRYQQ